MRFAFPAALDFRVLGEPSLPHGGIFAVKHSSVNITLYLVKDGRINNGFMVAFNINLLTLPVIFDLLLGCVVKLHCECQRKFEPRANQYLSQFC